MKIVYLANARMPTEKAHGVQIAKMCEAFVRQGIDLELVLPRRLNPIKQNFFDYYGVKPFKIKKLPCLDLIALKIPKIGFWIESISFAFFCFFYCLKKEGIIYSRDLPVLFLLSFLKKDIVLELHNPPQHFFLYRRVFKKAKTIIVLTKLLKKNLRDAGVDRDKILVASDAVDLKKFNIKKSKKECRKKLHLPLDKKVILYAGSFQTWKGVQTLKNASKLLPNNVSITLIGGSNPKPYSQVSLYLKAADVLVLPNSKKSKLSQWTSPMKMFEYMASKRPIVASDLSSIREILNEKNVVFFEPDNPKDLAEKIKLTLKDKLLSDRVRKQAFEDVKRYTWDKRARKIVKFIDDSKS